MIDPEIRCVEFVELVTDWMESALDDVTLAHFEEHAVICPPCAEYVTQIRTASRHLHDLQHEAPPPAAREALLDMFRAESGRQS